MPTKKKKSSSKKATKRKTSSKKTRAPASTAQAFGVRKNARKAILKSLLGFTTEGRGKKAIKDEIRNALIERGDVHPAVLEAYVSEIEGHYYRLVYCCNAIMNVDIEATPTKAGKSFHQSYATATAALSRKGLYYHPEEVAICESY